MSDQIASIRAAIAGRYEIDREIGQGAFATVYLARDLRHERSVAFKVLNADPDSEESELRFLREIRFLAQLQHPNILPLIDSGHAGAMLYYVMPFVSGETLRARLQRERQFTASDAISIAREVADGLYCAHRAGLIHRDIKPENVLLSAGHPMIADFGIARAIDNAGVQQLTRTGSLSPGTPAYMSPEQLLNTGTELDGRSDTYSLGCVLYEMLTGRAPFTGKDGFARRFTEPPPLPSAARPDLPPQLDEIISVSMARQVADRYHTAQAMCEALASVEAGHRRSSTPVAAIPAVSVIPAVTPVAQPPHFQVSRSRSARYALAATAAVLCVVAIMAVVRHARRDHLTAGHQALAAGRISDAVNEFRAAAGADTGSRTASLWLAQSLLLAGADSLPEWRRAAAHAASGAQGMVVVDARRANALAAMADGRYDHACKEFEGLHSSLPNDPSVTFSLATCEGRDVAVVRDSGTKTWRFRGDRATGVRLYQDLLEQLPAGHEARHTIYTELPALLTLEWGKYRAGRGWPDTAQGFGAFPALVHRPTGDAVVYAPHALSEFRAGQPWMNPPSMEQAWAHDRAVLKATALAAIAEEPQSAQAHALLAQALELSGNLATDAADSQSALSEIRTARASASARKEAPADAVPLQFTQVRLLVKTEQFAAARALADSTIAMFPHPSHATATYVGALEALVGHARQLAALGGAQSSLEQRMPDGRTVQINPSLAATVLALSTYAQLGGPRDSIVVLKDRAERQIRSYASPQARDSVRAALLGRSLSLAVPVLGPSAVAGLLTSDRLTLVQQALARGDTADVRNRLRVMRESRSGHSTAAVRLDQVFQEAWIRTAIGDSTGATQQLDDALNGLPALGTSFLLTISEAGAVARAMLLRAALAKQQGDDTVERRWSTAARTLLSGADPELRPR